ncbi:Ultraviolet-B receptor UVR8 [Symbiodinium microadriaticum]|uniref:Ultraviolet-B receptor UVR8 n=1 Tax=Symbiodinium microadriaticum TaxID=2951 RepID=A0A1Q9CAX1_SYMMI|nr:Ultraviolet-B receptor UVR8 [Symbiodinium microadriaticum]
MLGAARMVKRGECTACGHIWLDEDRNPGRAADRRPPDDKKGHGEGGRFPCWPKLSKFRFNFDVLREIQESVQEKIIEKERALRDSKGRTVVQEPARSLTPQRAMPGLEAREVRTSEPGVYHACAVRSDGQLVRVGWNTDGQCDVATDLRAAAGNFHTCAVRSDGQLVCFGLNCYGQCDVPTDLGAVVAVSAGGYNTCAVRSDGQLVCFGRNGFGQCDVPTDLGAVLAVSAGFGHTCAVRSDGQLVCFGWKYCGQCDVPTDLGAVVAVSAGDFHTCTVRSNGQLVCLGDNADGQCDVPTGALSYARPGCQRPPELAEVRARPTSLRNGVDAVDGLVGRSVGHLALGVLPGEPRTSTLTTGLVKEVGQCRVLPPEEEQRLQQDCFSVEGDLADDTICKLLFKLRSACAIEKFWLPLGKGRRLNPGDLIVTEVPVYGLDDAPAEWRATVAQSLVEVDDFIISSDPKIREG